MAEKSVREPPLNVYLTVEHYEYIGRFVAAWNQIELLMDNCVRKLLDVDAATANEIMGGYNVAQRANILIAAANSILGAESFAKTVVKACNKAKALSNDRNEIVHGRWTGAEVSGVRFSQASKASFEIEAKIALGKEPKTITLDDLKSHYEKACDLGQQFVDCYHQIREVWFNRRHAQKTLRDKSS